MDKNEFQKKIAEEREMKEKKEMKER